jgi:hypothetical protein
MVDRPRDQRSHGRTPAGAAMHCAPHDTGRTRLHGGPDERDEQRPDALPPAPAGDGHCRPPCLDLRGPAAEAAPPSVAGPVVLQAGRKPSVRALEGADRGIVEPRAERHREPPRVDDREQRVEMPRQQPARQHGERALAERAEESSDLDGHDAGGARPVPPREYRAAFSYAVAVEEPPPSRRHRTAAHAARWPDCLDRGRLDADRWLTVREIDKVHPLDSQNPSTRRGLRAARPGPPPRPFQAAGMAMPRSPATAPSRPAPP